MGTIITFLRTEKQPQRNESFCSEMISKKEHLIFLAVLANHTGCLFKRKTGCA
jgi:hypothetical protein